MNFNEIKNIFDSIKKMHNCPICNNLIKNSICISNDHYLCYMFFTFIYLNYEYICDIEDTNILIRRSINETYDVNDFNNNFEDYITFDCKNIDVKSYKELYDYIYKVVENSIFL